MSIPSRPTKPNGSGDFTSGETLTATLYNGDINPLYSTLDGDVDDDNLSESADVDPTKIGDASASASAMATVTTPGTVDSESLPTTLTGEIQRIRYVLGMIGQGSTGSNVKRNDGSSKDVPWYERTIRHGNHLANPSFETQTGGAGTAPDRWALVGTPTTVSLVDTDVLNGDGKACRIVADAAGEGIQQTLAGLSASSLYFISVRVKVAVGTVRLVTTGASGSSEFRNVDISSTSATATQLNAIIQTDSTPTNIVVQLLSNANLDDFQVDNVSFQRVGAQYATVPTGPIVIRDSSTDTTTLANSETAFPGGDQLSAAVTVPCPGCTILVEARLRWTTGTGTNNFVGILNETPASTGTPAKRDIGSQFVQNSATGSLTLAWVNTAPTPGETYTYTTTHLAQAASGTANGTAITETLQSNLIVTLLPPG